MSAGNNGVRNLRAMFENKASDQSTSPPSRGRSPNPSEFSNGSRPVSKVRASFVAVERPGENGGPAILGLRRASEVSSLGGIQENVVMDTDTTDKPAAKDSNTSAVATSVTESPPAQDGGLGNILKGSAFVENTPSKPSKPSQEATNLAHALATGKIQQKIPHSSPSKPKDSSNAAQMIEKMQPTNGTKPEPPPTTTLKVSETAQPVKAPPTRQINTKAIPKSPIVTKPSPKTPTSPKLHIKGGVGKIKGVMESAKEAQKAREEAKEKNDKPDKPQVSVPKVDTQTKPKTALGASKKEQTATSPTVSKSPATVKPKPPTMPGKLPAAAMATTASTAAKHDPQHSPTEPERKTAVRKTSSVPSRPPRTSVSSTTHSLAKKSSRASLTNGHERPVSRASSVKPDEGFLARMMRPTASSAQKTHEKLQVHSPPKAKKTAHATKTKSAAKQEGPPKMALAVPTEAQDQNQDVPEEVAHSSPLDAVQEDSVVAEAEPEPEPEPVVATEAAPTTSAEQVSGEAQEVH